MTQFIVLLGLSLSSVFTFGAVFILYALGLAIDRRRGEAMVAVKGILE